MRGQGRYETLDALRGVAALAVVVYHLGQVKLGAELVPHGYLAVDFFFVLSGFVVAHAYEEDLRRSLSFKSFALRRAIRIYPLATLGAIAGFLLLLIKWHLAPEKVDPLPSIFVSSLLNGLLLPTPFTGGETQHDFFIGNGPLWTLSLELAANLAWAAWGVHLRTRSLLAVVVIAGLAVAALSWKAGTANLGYDLATAPAGVARVSFGFTLGVVLFRICGDSEWISRLRSDRTEPVLIGILLLAIFAIPRSHSLSSFALWDIVSILFLLPMLVVVGIAQNQKGRLGIFLGEISFPIYVLHYPILLLGSGLHQSVLAHVTDWVMAAMTTVAAIAAALLASRFNDVPVRGWVSHFQRRRSLRPPIGSHQHRSIKPDRF